MKMSHKCVRISVAIGIMFCVTIFSGSLTSLEEVVSTWWENNRRLEDLCLEISKYFNFEKHHDLWFSWCEEAEERTKKFLLDPMCRSEWAIDRIKWSFYWMRKRHEAMSKCYRQYMEHYSSYAYHKNIYPKYLKLNPRNREGFQDIVQVMKASKDNINWLVGGVTSREFLIKWGKFMYPEYRVKDESFARLYRRSYDKPSKNPGFIANRVATALEDEFYSLEDYYQNSLAWTLDKYVKEIKYWWYNFSRPSNLEKALRRKITEARSRRAGYSKWFFLGNFLSQANKEVYYKSIRGIAETQKLASQGIEKVFPHWMKLSEMRDIIQKKYEAIRDWEQKLKEYEEVRIITYYRTAGGYIH